jgi:hypothetical protein
VVATWIAEVQGERLAAERILAGARRTPMTPDDVRALLEGPGDLSAVIREADPVLKSEVYADLGLRMVYRPAENMVSVEALPLLTSRDQRQTPGPSESANKQVACAKGGVGGGT